MKQKLLLFLSLFLLILGGNVCGKTLEVDLSSLPETETNTTWKYDASTQSGTFAWTTTYYNQLTLKGLSGDLFAYDGITIESEKGTAPDGGDETALALDHFRLIVKFTNGASQVTAQVETGTKEFTWKALGISDDNMHYVQCIQISGAADKPGNVTIKKIMLSGADVEYIEATKSEYLNLPLAVTDLKELKGTNSNWAGTVKAMEFAVQGKCYGDGDGSNEGTHVSIDGYDYLHLYVSDAETNSCGLRVWIWDDTNKKVVTLYLHAISEAATVSDWTKAVKITAPGVYVVKISGYKYLKGIKAANDWECAPVYVMGGYMSKSVPVSTTTYTTYSLKGSVLGETASLTEALADTKCLSINATALTTTTPITLTPANPNCIFRAKECVLANESNVAVDGTIANLTLADGYSFQAPENVKATKAQYTRELNTKFGTVVLPFAATSTDVKFYEIKNMTDEAITLEEVQKLAAGTPAIIEKTADNDKITITGEGNISNVTETPQADGAVMMHGSYTQGTTVTDANSYYIKEDKFYSINDNFVCNAFRGYFTTVNPTAAARLAIITDNNVTGVNAVEAQENANIIVEVYNAAGVQQKGMQKGINIARLANGKTVTVIVK